MRRSRLRLALVLVAALSVAGLGAPANAATDAAEEAVSRGLRHMGAGEYGQALREFLEAKSINPAPRVSVQIGIAKQALGQFVEAEENLLGALQATNDPWIKKNRVAIEKALADVQGHLCKVVVRGAPPGAEVRVNSEPVGTLPLRAPIRLVAGGRFRVSVDAHGYSSQSDDFPLDPGETAIIHIDLQKLPPPVPDVPSAVVIASVPLEPVEPPGRSVVRGGAWVFLTAGAIALIGGGLLLAEGRARMAGAGLVAGGGGGATVALFMLAFGE